MAQQFAHCFRFKESMPRHAHVCSKATIARRILDCSLSGIFLLPYSIGVILHGATEDAATVREFKVLAVTRTNLVCNGLLFWREFQRRLVLPENFIDVLFRRVGEDFPFCEFG